MVVKSTAAILEKVRLEKYQSFFKPYQKKQILYFVTIENLTLDFLFSSKIKLKLIEK